MSSAAAKPDLVVIAALAGAHGVRGDAKIKPFGDPALVCSYGPFLDKAGAVILTPTRAKPGPNGTVIVQLEQSLTREQVQAMKGTLLHVPHSALPELDEDEFYYADLIGLAVEDLDGASLGKIKSVQDFGAGDLLEISGPDGVWFLPFTKDAAPHVDLAAGKVIANPPDVIEGDEDGNQ